MKLIAASLFSTLFLTTSAKKLRGTPNQCTKLSNKGTTTLDMFKASKPDKPVLSKAKVSVDCESAIMCVTVSVVPPAAHLTDVDKPDEHFVKINDKKAAEAFEENMVKENGEYVGWEVCFPTTNLGPGPLEMKIHANVWEDGESQTSATPGCDSICLYCNGGGGGGDPHFKTWSGHKFDYHGACDLKLVESKSFASGQGLEVQIRTEQQDWFSFISDVALRIGNEVLEIGRNGQYYLNGVKNTELPTTLSGFPIKYYAEEKGSTGHIEHVYDIDIEGETLRIRAFKDFMYVDFLQGSHLGLADSVGLMGSWEEGKMLARDGKTVLEEWLFGPEWQVRDDEEMLFQIARAPQYPTKCTPPIWEQEKETKISRQMVEESSGVDRSAAEAACAHWGKDKEQCIADVMATGDLELATLDDF